MEDTFDDSTAEGIHFRDKWQFELKSELLPDPQAGESRQIQEFYLFIPNALQINDQTYTKEQFYVDQTNLIRFKTPHFTMEELLDYNIGTPFSLLRKLLNNSQTPENYEVLQKEVKLLGAIFRSSLRDKLIEFNKRLTRIKKPEGIEQFKQDMNTYLDELGLFMKEFRELKEEYLKTWPLEKVENLFSYVEDFLILAQENGLTQFLHRLRLKQSEELTDLDKRLVELLLYKTEFVIPTARLDESKEEFILYREALLNKFVIDPLLLKTDRSSVDQRYKNIIASIPAAVAMLIYMILFAWQWNYFIVNSEPFILLTVVIYVMKDRIKEELRLLSYQKAAKWFSDYTTEIHSNGDDLGTLRESFTFVQEAQVDPKILQIRNKDFHGVLKWFKRPEQIIFYKKSVRMSDKLKSAESPFYGLNLIFRLDIHHFLAKAEDAFQQTLVLDPVTKMIRRVQLPRVYHINIIIKTIIGKKGAPQISKFRLIVDKNGIKRVENLTVS